MTEILQLGPFAINLKWLLMALSAVVGYAAMQWKVKSSDFRDRPILDKLTNGVLIVFLVWKLSPVFFTPSILWKYPAGLLTMSGPLAGFWLGMAAAALYLEINLRRIKVPGLVFLDLLSLGMAVTLFLYSLLGWQYGTATSLPWGISVESPEFKYHPVNVYLIMITLPVLVWQWKTNSSPGSGKRFVNFLTFYGMGLMLVSLFKQKNPLFYGLSGEQLIYLMMMISGIALSMFLHRENVRNSNEARIP